MIFHGRSSDGPPSISTSTILVSGARHTAAKVGRPGYSEPLWLNVASRKNESIEKSKKQCELRSNTNIGARSPPVVAAVYGTYPSPKRIKKKNGLSACGTAPASAPWVIEPPPDSVLLANPYAARFSRAWPMVLSRGDLRSAIRDWNNRPFAAAMEIPKMLAVSFMERSCN